MLTTNEVAQTMGVAYTTVMLWIKQGKLEAIKREHPRGDYYEVPASALTSLERGSKGRPKTKAEGEVAAASAITEKPETKPKPAKKLATKKKGN